MIGKILWNKNENTKYISYNILNCEVENVGFYKENSQYNGFDIASGLLIAHKDKKQDLINFVNENKDRIKNARENSSYKNFIERLNILECINTISEVEEELKHNKEINELTKETKKDDCIIISDKNTKAKAKHLKDDIFLYHKMEEFNNLFTIHYNLAIQYKDKLYDISINVYEQEKENYNFDNAIQEVLKLIEQQNFNCNLDNYIQKLIIMVDDKKWIVNWLLVILADYDYANKTNYYNKAIQVKEEIKALRQKEDMERKQKEEEKERVFLEEKQNEVNSIVNNAIEEMRKDNQHKIINKELEVYTDKYSHKTISLLNYLFDKYNIKLPIKTKGFINDIDNVNNFSKNQYRGRKSKVIFTYLNELYDKIGD